MPTELEMAISQQLKKLREARDLSQEKLARLIDVSSRTVQSWEKQARFAFTDAIEIARVLECTLDDLAGDEAPARPRGRK
jgi:DNA-binding XRE family transcriptional regulator